MSVPIKQRIIEQLDTMPAESHQQVLDFARRLGQAVPEGTAGESLLRFSGTIPDDDLQAMSDAIEAGCERVGDEW